jgi:hypothetical protein
MRSLTLAIASLLFITFTGNAQNIKKTPKVKYTKPFTVELGGDILYSNTSYHYESTGGTYNESYDYTDNLFSVDANAGIFVINGLKLGIEPTITVTIYSGGNTSTQLGLYFVPEYVFNTKSIVYPYIGGSIGYTYKKHYNDIGISPTADGLSYGAKAGLKVNFFGNSLLNFGFTFYSENYNSTYNTIYTTYDNKTRYDRVALTLGWSVFF